MKTTIKLLRIALVLSSSVALTACGSTPKIAGNWITDDGRCQGMYYNGTTPLDIGGGMTCSLGSKKDTNGRYALVVSQPPNQASYSVEFTGSDTAVVYSGSTKIYTMTRR